MSEQKKQKRPIHKSPLGIARYPKLSRPDTKFNKDGVYSVDLLLQASADETQKLIEQIDGAVKQAVEDAKKEAKGKKVKAADTPYSEVMSEGDDPQPTGDIKFRFKLNATGKAKDRTWQQRPAIFDAKGNLLKAEDLKIGGGSKIKVAYELVPFYVPAVGAGVSLRMKAVQIIEMVEWTGGSKDASDYGFDKEDGYEAASEAPAGDETTAAGDGQGDEF